MIDKEELINHINECQGKKILVIGDIMLDEYHWCTVKRISPEAPVPVCKVRKTTLVPGGAGNVAKNISSLKNIAYLIGVIGNDSSGQKLLDVLAASAINTDYVVQEEDRATTLKSRIVAHQQHVVRVDREEVSNINRKTANKIYKNVIECLSQVDILLISDYLKGLLPAGFLQKIIKTAKENRVHVIIDPKGRDYKKYKGAYVLTPNLHEFETVIKKQDLNEKEILTEGLKLIKRLQLHALVLTRSEKGVSIITEAGKKIDVPTKAREVYDITGAGDTFISVLTISLAAGWSIEKASFLANYAAGIVVGKIGTSATTFEEIKESVLHE
ncbi:D-glycero-beta-D-manno-heptose-7-phosphate kinase [Candidatus Margulisiibacteriota bacterium]